MPRADLSCEIGCNILQRMPEESPILISVVPEDAGKRLDQFLAARLEAVSRARVQELISEE